MRKYFIILLVLSALLISCGKGSETADKSCCASKDTASCETTKEVIPDESLFNLKDQFKTQDNQAFTLDMLNGKPTVVGMVFTHCAYACPRLTADMISIADSVNRGDVNFLLVSFDVERDTPERLKYYATKSGLNKNWTLLHGGENAVRTLSVLLNVQYEKDAEGNFSHSNIVSVLDKQGRLQFQKEGLGADHAQTINTIKKLVQQQ